MADKVTPIHRLSTLYEESPDGVAFHNWLHGYAGSRAAKKLGKTIARTMGFPAFVTKSKARTAGARARGSLARYPQFPNYNTGMSGIKNPRHRKFFGITKPQDPH